MQSMLLSLQQGFLRPALPPPLTVHPAVDDRRSRPLRSLTPLPHSKVALQLLQGSTVWSCPVWLQTKHQRDSGTTSDHQTGLHVILTRGEEDGLRHSTFCVTFATMPFQSAYSVYRHLGSFACVCECVFFFLILEQLPLPLWQTYCPSQLVTVTMLMHLVYIVDVYSSGVVKVMTIGHLTAIRCQQEPPTA